MKASSSKDLILSDLSETKEQEHWNTGAYAVSDTQVSGTKATFALPSRRESDAGYGAAGSTLTGVPAAVPEPTAGRTRLPILLRLL